MSDWKPDRKINPEFYEMADDLIDEEITKLRARVVAGYTPPQEDIIAVLDQLAQDRAAKRAYTQRARSTVQ